MNEKAGLIELDLITLKSLTPYKAENSFFMLDWIRRAAPILSDLVSTFPLIKPTQDEIMKLLKELEQ